MPIECTPASTVISDTLDGDTIVIDIQSGAYYTLTPAAGRLWEQAQARSACEPVDAADEAVLDALLTEGLLVAVAADSPDRPAPSAADPAVAFTRYTDMEELLLADPIHDVDDQGWPVLRAPGSPG